MILHEKISAQLPEWRERIKTLAKEHGDVIVDHVTVGQVIGGMRNIKSLLTDISSVDPAEGIRFRGMTIPETLKALPKARGNKMPMVGGLYYLLMVGEVPTKEQAMEVEAEWAKRAELPDHVYKMLKSMPKETHPMTLFSQAVLALQNTSVFAAKYHSMKKDEYWEAALEDSLNLTARLPMIAAFIYRMKYFDETKKMKYNPKQDYGMNFARMMKVSDKKGYAELARLYFIIHSDHESGNASAHAMHLAGSTLSDAYYCLFIRVLNALAGPLHGLANQECLAWLLDVHKKFGGVPSREDLYKFAWDTLNSGHVIPGYGHAVLRVTDPRFTAQMEFAKKRFPEDDLVRLADMVYRCGTCCVA